MRATRQTDWWFRETTEGWTSGTSITCGTRRGNLNHSFRCHRLWDFDSHKWRLESEAAGRLVFPRKNFGLHCGLETCVSASTWWTWSFDCPFLFGETLTSRSKNLSRISCAGLVALGATWACTFRGLGNWSWHLSTRHWCANPCGHQRPGEICLCLCHVQSADTTRDVCLVPRLTT